MLNEEKDIIDYKQTLVEQLVSVERVSFNIDQSVIVTTEDKIRLTLDAYFKNTKMKGEWVTPLALLIAIITTLVTTTFNDFFLSGATWKAIFIITGIGSAGWLFQALLALRNKTTIEDLIDEIRTGNRCGDFGDAGGSD